jgi:hypothetical protein
MRQSRIPKTVTNVTVAGLPAPGARGRELSQPGDHDSVEGSRFKDLSDLDGDLKISSAYISMARAREDRNCRNFHSFAKRRSAPGA